MSHSRRRSGSKRERPRHRARTIRRALLIALLTALFPPVGGATSYATAVNVFPSPGSHFASPNSQIVFRGISVDSIGAVTVTGSASGNHSGRMAGDSDGKGGSFLPAAPFAPGETVSVKTHLSIIGASGGAFSFAVASPAGKIPTRRVIPAPRKAGDVSHFRSRPDLAPARLAITKQPSHTFPGDIFVAPQRGPLQNGPMLLDSSGNLVWFKPLPPNTWATDFRVQRYQGKSVLTWWQGNESAGTGVGVGVISDTSYNVIKYVTAGYGLNTDMHEFDITPQGTAFVTSYYPVYADARSVKGGLQRQIVFDGVVQEIDISTGLVVFEWDSLDHVPLSDSFTMPPHNHGHPFDYIHVNSVQQDFSGNVIISARNTWAVYDVDHRTGGVIWRLGGKEPTFKMGPGTGTAWQHDALLHRGGVMSIFDNGAGPPRSHSQSRGILVRLDTRKKSATLIREFDHNPRLSANFEGNLETLPGGDLFAGWGQQPYFSEFNSHGQTVFDARFVGGNNTYRAYRFRWSGTPQTSPAVAASTSGKTTTVWATWNGATSVAAWRVLAGSSATTLHAARTVRKNSFETSTEITGRPAYVAVQALDTSGRVLKTSVAAKA